MENVVSLRCDKSGMTNSQQFKHLAGAYIQYYVPVKRRKSMGNEINKIQKWILPFLGELTLDQVTPVVLTQLHAAISAEAPVQANRVLQTIRAMFARAESLGFPAMKNPARGIVLNREVERVRYLSADEQARLSAAVDAYPNVYISAAIKVLTLTGCRKNEILKAKWTQLDVTNKTLRLPDTKNGRPFSVYICEKAMAILLALPRNSKWIFPSARGNSKPTADIKKAWAIICEQAGIEDAHVHDLRHTFASNLAAAGVPLPVVGSALNQISVRSTQRYVHVASSAVAQAIEQNI